MTSKHANLRHENFRRPFSPRQLVALTTFSDLVGEAREKIEQDALAAGLPDDGVPLRDGGRGALAYAEAVSAFGVDGSKSTSSLTIWADFIVQRPLDDKQFLWFGIFRSKPIFPQFWRLAEPSFGSKNA
ncbi:MAG: hypothetical protein R3C43_18720 [Chloroflexota bacterium]